MMNVPLFSAIFTIAFTVIIGILMVVIIVLDKANTMTMIGCVGVGTLISIPISAVVSKKLGSLKSDV